MSSKQRSLLSTDHEKVNLDFIVEVVKANLQPVLVKLMIGNA